MKSSQMNKFDDFASIMLFRYSIADILKYLNYTFIAISLVLFILKFLILRIIRVSRRPS